VRRLSLWMRAHPMVGDTLIALLIAGVDVGLFVSVAVYGDGNIPPWYLTLPVDLAMGLPLAFRRRYPMTVAYVVLAVSIPHSMLQLGFGSLAGSAIAVYSMVVYVERRKAACYLALQLLTTVVQLTLDWQTDTWVSLAIVSLMLALCWVLGEFVGARQAYHAELEARLHLLETERDQAGRIAVAAERSRIARELHDVVAHAVSVIVVQADGASYAVRSNPELAERAVQTISHTGREALAELRRLLEVLRSENTDGEPRIPQPDARSLAELVERVRGAGLPVRLEIDSALTGLPAGVSLGLYRIVQESLTNTLKHAGRGARAEVLIRRSGDLVEVEVLDDGAGKAPALVAPERLSANREMPGQGESSNATAGGSRARSQTGTEAGLPGGNGVIGMRERAHLFGGALEVGPQAGGGWRVHASLPIRLP
jgi:signal transduction histidine kinase